ncbi:LysM peptidoglycan-binding domain-containing protein [Actinomadura chibensis]|nr:LysM domain-containing protein [Actinomadura chibensis]
MSDSPHGDRRHGGRRRGDRVPVRLTRRGRAALIGFAATVTLVALWGNVGQGAFAGDGGSGSSRPARTVVVGPGDTLWGIASAADPGADPRRVVQRIIDLNGLGGDPTVRPGQELRLPAG